MKKRILALLAVICVSFTMLLTACVPSDLKPHTWSDEWKHTITKHWHYCTVPNCAKLNDEAEHDLVIIEIYDGREPTCGKSGRGIYQCVDCGVTIEDKIPATGEHEWVLYAADIPATCFEAGEGTYFCKVCGEVSTSDIEPTGQHTYVEGKWSITKEGHEQLCEVCKKTSGLLPHEKVYSEELSSKATATSDGAEVYVCAVCGYEIERTVLLATDVPNELTVAFNGADITKGDDGFWHVTLKLNTRYNVSYVATTPSGGTVATGYASMASSEGIHAYLVDNRPGNLSRLDPISNSDTIYLSPMENGPDFIQVRTRGTYEVTFAYQLEDLDDETAFSRARATFFIIIDCV